MRTQQLFNMKQDLYCLETGLDRDGWHIAGTPAILVLKCSYHHRNGASLGQGEWDLVQLPRAGCRWMSVPRPTRHAAATLTLGYILYVLNKKFRSMCCRGMAGAWGD